MRWDLDQCDAATSYKLLAATVMPRPIAWVVTKNAAGQINAAPYSFFNVMGSVPPTIALGIMADPARGYKDSARNILETGEFVVNLVPEALVGAANQTSIDAPYGVDELALAGLATTQSRHIAPPRISQSPVAFECRSHTTVETGPHQLVVIGQVIAVHIEDRFILDANRAHIDTPALDLVARSYGADYIRSRDSFQLQRPAWADRQLG